MKVRKPALLAATLALAITPALTSVAPASAAPKAAPAAAPALAAAELDLNAIITQVLAVFPADIQGYANEILAGNYANLLPLVQAVFSLTPQQLIDIFGQLQAVLTEISGGLGGTPTPAPTVTVTVTATPEATATTPVETTAPAARAAGADDAQAQKVVWTLDALLGDAGDKHGAKQLSNLIITLFTVAAR
ncbi:hypothetical protein GCM10022221_07980 [Actinocorallia aurea]